MLRFLFNKITPTLTIILVLVLALVIVGFIFRKKSTLMLRTILGPIVLIGIGIVIYSFTRAIKPPLTPMSSTAMFKKMEYIEHLKLVSFYSEEVLVLGTKEKVQKLVDKLEEEFKDLSEELVSRELALANIQEDLDELIVDMVEDEEAFEAEKQRLKDQESELKKCEKCNAASVCAKPTGFSDIELPLVYESYTKAIDSFRVAEAAFNSKPWKSLKKKPRRNLRKSMKDNMELKETELEGALAEMANMLEREIEIGRKKFEDLKRTNSDASDRQKDLKKSYTKQRDAHKRAWKKTLEKQKKIERKLNEAKLELAFARESREDIDPEVLIIAPAEISVYINMKEVAMNIEEMEDSVVIVQIPPIEFDPALIELPDSATVYEVDRNKNEFVSSKQGAYYDLFGQLKATVLEKQSEVKAKAIENGILVEGEKMARVYLENFMRPLGLKMEFVPMEGEL